MFLYVLYLTVGPSLEVEEKYQKQKVKGGSQFMIPVSYHGYPTPDLEWTLNGKSAESLDNVKVEKMENSCTLRVKDSGSNNNGKYKVKAENEVGSVTVEIEVTVIGQSIALIFICAQLTVHVNLTTKHVI